MTIPLAQAGSGGGSGSIVVWVIVLMLATIFGFWLAIVIRKHALSSGDDATEGLTLGALRDMHARGDLDDEEYERARAAILARAGVDPDKARPLDEVQRPPGFTRRASPGVDLTGAPLPDPGNAGDAENPDRAN